MKKSASKRFEILLSMAKQQTRPQLEKELGKARKEFAAAQQDYLRSMSEFTAAQTKVEEAQSRMATARRRILDVTKFVQTMDLTGANAIRQRGENINYIMDGKEFHVDLSDPDDIHTVPWKEYKALRKEEGNEVDDDDDSDEKESSE